MERKCYLVNGIVFIIFLQIKKDIVIFGRVWAAGVADLVRKVQEWRSVAYICRQGDGIRAGVGCTARTSWCRVKRSAWGRLWDGQLLTERKSACGGDDPTGRDGRHVRCMSRRVSLVRVSPADCMWVEGV